MPTISVERLNEIMEAMRAKTIIVIGDLMLDRYIWGNVERISPEAPVPVLDVRKEDAKLGGAGNVANNLMALGARVMMASVVGNDLQGKLVKSLLQDEGIDTRHIQLAEDRQTIVKTRIIAQHQQIVRIDREDRSFIPEELRSGMIESVREAVNDIDAIIISDYAKGMVSEHLVSEVVKIAKTRGIPVCVDPKERNFPFYRGVTLITPNKKELTHGAGMPLESQEDVINAANKVKTELGCEMVLATRGEEGMSLFESDGRTTHIPTAAKKVFDVTGAGDTVISCFTLALAAGATPPEAALLSNAAAGITVGEVGAASIEWERLKKVCTEELCG